MNKQEIIDLINTFEDYVTDVERDRHEQERHLYSPAEDLVAEKNDIKVRLIKAITKEL